MPESIWKIQQLRNQAAVLDGQLAPTIVLKNARFLHSLLKAWIVGNIWIYGDRIVYVGNEMPSNMDGTEIVDLTGKTVVPGYIEPHVHPFQLYNPVSFAEYAAQLGTTTFISDNMSFIFSLPNKKTFTLLEELKKIPFSYYWWARFDGQTELENDNLFTTKTIYEWLERDDVLLGGELTGWPKITRGDDQMLYWIQMAKKMGKKIEGHFPGASEKTLAKMVLFGTTGDHEAMTIEDVEKRILHGYAVTLRYSSIRPDLPNLLKGIVEKKLPIFDSIMMTTDGATPFFYKEGVMDNCIKIALDCGVDPIDAYHMVSYNIAKYYDLSQLHGMIATGRFATINILENEYSPVPESVLSKGVWIKKNNKKTFIFPEVNWDIYNELKIDFELDESDFQFSIPIGLKLINEVITKPYSVNAIFIGNEFTLDDDECFLMLLDRKGNWRVNTLLKGFATNVTGFASSYSNTGDIILIGKNKEDMKLAFQIMKNLKGGIVLVENGQLIASIPLEIGGTNYKGNLELLIELEEKMKQALAERGHNFSDAIYTLLFLQSTHLPYVRITQRGIIDVMKQRVMLPSVMR